MTIKNLRIVIILLALSLLLCGCKAGEKDAANTPAAETTSAAEAAPEPDDGCPLPPPEAEDEPEGTLLVPRIPEPEDPANDARGFLAENQDLLERAAEEMRGKKMSVFAGIMTGWNEGWNQWKEIIKYDLSEDLQTFRTLSEQWQFSAEWTEDGACFVIALPENGDASHAAYEVRLLYAENAPEQADESLAEHWYLRVVPFYDVSGEKSLYDIWKAGKDFIELFPVGKARYAEENGGVSHWVFERFTVTGNEIVFEDSLYWHRRTLISATYDLAADTLHIVYSDGSTAEAKRAEGYRPLWNDTGVEYNTFPAVSREERRAEILVFLEKNRAELERAAEAEDFDTIIKMAEDTGEKWVRVSKNGPGPAYAEDADPYIVIRFSTMIDVTDRGDIYPGLLYRVSLIYTTNTEDQIKDEYFGYFLEPIAENWYIMITDNGF